MTAALLEHITKRKIDNIFFHINHITVPQPMKVLLESDDCKIDAFIGPSHVSVITGSKIYEEFVKDYKRPVVVAGFEPVDVMQSILAIANSLMKTDVNLK